MPAAKRPAAKPAAKPATQAGAKPALPARKAAAAPKAAPKPVKPAAAAKPVVASTAKTAMASTARSAAKPAREPAPTLPVPVKAPKVKLVRDSFAMPAFDHGQIAVLKKRALAFQRPAKKSELLRAGLHALVALDDKALKAALDALAAVKTGRPKKH